MKKQTKQPKPIDLWVPDYYSRERTPESLFANELQFSQDSYDRAVAWAHLLFKNLHIEDPHGIMTEFGNVPAVRVANHRDFTDPMVLGTAYVDGGYANPRYAAMAELFKASNPKRAEFIAQLGGYPVDRARLGAREFSVVRRFIEMSRYVLEELQQPLDMFPGGRIISGAEASTIGEVGSGTLKIAKKHPIVVLGIHGNRKAYMKPWKVEPTIVASSVLLPEDKPDEVVLKAHMQRAMDLAIEIYHSKKS